MQRQAGNILIWMLLVTVPFWLPAIGGYTQLGSRVVIMALAATSLNFLVGYTGVMSFGHAAYFGVGAYGAGLTIKYLLPETLPAMAVGIIAATVAAAIIGALIVRLRGIYFAMVTIAFGQVFYFIAYRWNDVTGGDDGLSGWHREPVSLGPLRLDILHDERAFYYFALAGFAIVVAILAFLLRSPFGRTLLAIRENERRARFLGIPVDRHIWLSWMVSCIGVGVAGTLYALLNNFADPHDLRWDQSGNFVIMAVLGGMRSFWGPLIGAIIFVVLQDYISSQTENWMSFVGLFFVIVVLFFPRGVLGFLGRRSACVTILEVEAVSKRFGNLVALDDVSVHVEAGELCAIIGPNGAGKTTLFNLITGFLTPTSGRILFAGQDVSALPPVERVWRGMVRTFQTTQVFPELSVRDNLRIAVEIASGYRLRPWLPRGDANAVDAKIAALLAMGGLTGRADRRAGELSHGDQRAAEIMMTLALEPRLLLLDEPTAGMGDQETYDIALLIRRLHKDRKLTIVLIEHDMRVVFNLADRIFVMAEGALLASGTPRDVAGNEAVQNAYLGKAA